MVKNKNIKILQNLTNAQLAELNNCSVSTIKRFIKENDIGWNRYPLYNRYLNLIKEKPHISNKEISNLLNCSLATIGNFNKKLSRKSTFDYKYESFSIFEKSVLIGTLYGDGWLTHSSKNKNNYRGGFSHKIQNKDYVKYKKSLLEKHCNKLILKEKVNHNFIGRDINAQSQIYVNLKSNPYLSILYKDLYKRFENNRHIKKIDNDTLKYFTDISLALFFQDDGSKIINKVKNFYSYKIVMYDFDKESIENFQNFLLKKWNLKTTIQYCKICGYTIYIKSESKLKFYYLIKPYIVQSMLYKL